MGTYPPAVGSPVAVAAAATPSIPSRPAAFGLCTTAVTVATWGTDAIRRAIASAIDSMRSNDRCSTTSRTASVIASIVGGRLDRVVVDLDLQVEVHDERLRLVLLSGSRAVVALGADAGQEQAGSAHVDASSSSSTNQSSRSSSSRSTQGGRRSSWIRTTPSCA